MRVLVVEDFEVMARSIAVGLRREGMAVDVVLNGNDAMEHVNATRYDVVVLDRDIPGLHGDEVCRRMSNDGRESRVLMLTAASTVKDRVEGLGVGPTTTWRSHSTCGVGSTHSSTRASIHCARTTAAGVWRRFPGQQSSRCAPRWSPFRTERQGVHGARVLARFTRQGRVV